MSWKSVVTAGSAIALAACASAAPPSVQPASPVASTDMVWFTGASNFRSFSCSSSQVALSAEAALDEFDRTKADGMPAVRSAALAIPIRSLDCGISKMNDDLFATLGGAANPTISFRLSEYAVMKPGSPGAVRMNGLLRLAGREKQVVVYGMVVRDGNGQLRLRGEQHVDVRDFGVTPPRRFFGLVRVRPEVDVHFDVAVRPLVDPLGILTSSLR